MKMNIKAPLKHYSIQMNSNLWGWRFHHGLEKLFEFTNHQLILFANLCDDIVTLLVAVLQLVKMLFEPSHKLGTSINISPAP
jgi:hypothetical protein